MATVEEIKQEIVDYLNTEHGKWDTFTLSGMDSQFYQFVEDLTWRDAEIVLPSGTAKKVAFLDGGEGDYSVKTYLVFDVNGQLFRVDGQYESWDGTQWEATDMYEVVPTPVIVTEYRRKDENGI